MSTKKTFMRVVSILTFVFLFITSVTVTYAPIVSDATTIEEAQQEQKEAQEKIDSAEQWRDNEIEKRENLDKQISDVQTIIDDYQKQINTKTEEIEKKQQEIDDLSAALVKQNEDYITRAKMMIQKGNASNLEIILNSKSLDDMMMRMTIVKKIAEYDNNMLKKINESMEQVKVLKEELILQKEEVIALKEEQDAKKTELDGYRAESQEIIEQLQVDIEAYEKEYEEAKKKEQKAREEAERLRKEAESGTGPVVAPAQFVGGQFMWPSTSSYLVTSPYGYRIHPVTGVKRFHAGIDIGAAYGTDILAANSGTVIVAGYNAGGYGNYVVISHGGGYSTLYAHASTLCVSKGQTVTKGQVIAKCGSTGMSTGPHIHYEVQYNGQTTNPMQYYR